MPVDKGRARPCGSVGAFIKLKRHDRNATCREMHELEVLLPTINSD
jgi:hypothetical protein